MFESFALINIVYEGSTPNYDSRFVSWSSSLLFLFVLRRSDGVALLAAPIFEHTCVSQTTLIRIKSINATTRIMCVDFPFARSIFDLIPQITSAIKMKADIMMLLTIIASTFDVRFCHMLLAEANFGNSLCRLLEATAQFCNRFSSNVPLILIWHLWHVDGRLAARPEIRLTCVNFSRST